MQLFNCNKHRPTAELLQRTTRLSCFVTHAGFSGFQPNTHHSLTIQVSHTYFQITDDSCVLGLLIFCSFSHPRPLKVSAVFIEKQTLFIVKLSGIHPFLCLCAEAIFDSRCWHCLIGHSFCGHVGMQLLHRFFLLLPNGKAQHGPLYWFIDLLTAAY